MSSAKPPAVTNNRPLHSYWSKACRVPHPRHAFVFVARVGSHEANPHTRTRRPALESLFVSRKMRQIFNLLNLNNLHALETADNYDPKAHNLYMGHLHSNRCRRAEKSRRPANGKVCTYPHPLPPLPTHPPSCLRNWSPRQVRCPWSQNPFR